MQREERKAKTKQRRNKKMMKKGEDVEVLKKKSNEGKTKKGYKEREED